MLKQKTLILILLTGILSGCLGGRQPQEAGAKASLFEATPTPLVQKGEESDALEKALVTQAGFPAYPTPLPTYLVPAVQVNLTPQATAAASSVAPAATTAVSPSPAAPTATPVPATATPTPVAYTYSLQPGSPAYSINFANSSGCGWQGIAGQVFDANGAPVMNLVVRASGTWNGTTSNLLGMGLTGSALAYGEGGYEIQLGGTAVDSTGTVNVQLFDLAGVPLTAKIAVNTYGDCSKNLVSVNFLRQAAGYQYYVPLVVQTATP
jgi:hypothetical protein